MPFDIERYKASSKKLDLTDVDWSEVPRHPLQQGAIDAMHYMMDIETHTAIYLSELLVSRACMDPVITSFLACWVYEEMYHGEAFVKFLREYGVPVSPHRPREIRLREGFGRVNATMAIMFGSYLLPFFPAIYLTVGAINEMSTLTAYRRLQQHSDHPLLNEILERIIKQERNHFAFYRSMAESFLIDSGAARAATRWFMRHRFVVVGEGVKNAQEVDQLILYLFDGDDGRHAARAIDHSVDAMPGLGGLHLMEGLLNRSIHRTGLLPGTQFEPVPPAIAQLPEAVTAG
jgi:hypothetical protein